MAERLMSPEVDFIVVGAGSAGCVLAEAAADAGARQP